MMREPYLLSVKVFTVDVIGLHKKMACLMVMVDTMSRWAKAQTKRVEALTRRVAIIAVT